MKGRIGDKRITITTAILYHLSQVKKGMLFLRVAKHSISVQYSKK